LIMEFGGKERLARKVGPRYLSRIAVVKLKTYLLPLFVSNRSPKALFQQTEDKMASEIGAPGRI
jgi:hypothetical protein